MNIFVLDNDPFVAAEYHVDKHCVKQVLESAQLLCTAHHAVGGEAPYKASHINSPCAIWTRESLCNYEWLVRLGFALCVEYTYRYGKIHKSEAIIHWCAKNIPSISKIGLTPFVQVMPEHLRGHDAVGAYRRYYREEKSRLFSWKKREKPWWI